MTRAHDRGGRPIDGRIDRAEHDLAWWEKRTDAMMTLLSGPEGRYWTVDEMRRVIEDMDPAEYEARSYYERWLIALERLLVEKGLLTREEIDRKAAEVA